MSYNLLAQGGELIMSSERPRVAVVGCGYWGQNLVRNFHELGALAQICEIAPAGVEKAHQLAPEVPLTGSYDELLHSPVQGIVLATPATTHFELARRALEAGKDVFVEKPLALRFSEGEALVRLSESLNRILMVGHILEYHPAFVALKQLYLQGDLGQLVYLYSHRLSWGIVRTHENVLWNAAPHDLSMILRLTGELPRSVQTTPIDHLQSNIADVAQLNLRFAAKLPGAHIFASWLHPFKEQRLVVMGSQRSALFNGVNGQLTLYETASQEGPKGPVLLPRTEKDIPLPKAEPLRCECEAFLDSIASRRPPITDGRSGLRTLAVLEAAQHSIERGGWQDVPSVD